MSSSSSSSSSSRLIHRPIVRGHHTGKPHYKDEDACFPDLKYLALFITDVMREGGTPEEIKENKDHILEVLRNCLNRRLEDMRNKVIHKTDIKSEKHHQVIQNVFDVYYHLNNHYNWFRRKIINHNGIIYFELNPHKRAYETTTPSYSFMFNFDGLPQVIPFTKLDKAILFNLHYNERYDSDHNKRSIKPSYVLQENPFLSIIREEEALFAEARQRALEAMQRMQQAKHAKQAR